MLQFGLTRNNDSVIWRPKNDKQIISAPFELAHPFLPWKI